MFWVTPLKIFQTILREMEKSLIGIAEQICKDKQLSVISKRIAKEIWNLFAIQFQKEF